MKLNISGEEKFSVSQSHLWEALNDPAVLAKCIPGCTEMIETATDSYHVIMELKVAAVGGSFEGAIALCDKTAPQTCQIKISGEGTLGQGTGEAKFEIRLDGANSSILHFEGGGEIGGLVAGVGQRVLGGVSKHLVKRFFKDLRQELEGVNEKESA